MKPYILFGLVAALAVSRCDRGFAADSGLDSLFAKALAAEGSDYIIIRKEVVEQGQVALNFLESRQRSEDLHTRVVSAGIISWINNYETNQIRTAVLTNLISKASEFHSGMLRTLQGLAFGTLGSLQGPVPRNDALDDPAAAAFLLEVALKAAVPDSERAFAGATRGVWARCVAAGIVGEHAGQDTVPLLGELLTNADFRIRACAATGLRRAKTIDGTELLFKGLADENAEVRRTSRVGLMDITDQDFAEDRLKYLSWWNENKARWPFNDRRPGTKSLLLR
ncbi:MAG TPA: HEAT repeat domain-containing protein [Candidatus Dormibacteraeota bacterium]|nr:HEAT repeat domain-containing protein [Candidatus Dormibacteraeota bacterium]